MHVSNVIYAFGWRRSGLTLAHTKFKCNFAVDFTMRVCPTFELSDVLRPRPSGRSVFRTTHTHTPLQSESIRRTNASDIVFSLGPVSRGNACVQLIKLSITSSMRVCFFHLLSMFESKLSTVCSICYSRRLLLLLTHPSHFIHLSPFILTIGSRYTAQDSLHQQPNQRVNRSHMCSTPLPDFDVGIDVDGAAAEKVREQI